MKKLLLILCLLSFIPAAYSEELHKVDPSLLSKAKKISAVIPIYSEKLKFRLPLNWKAAYQNNQREKYIIEFIPKQESINQWRHILSIQGFKGLSKRFPAEIYIMSLGFNFKKICPGNDINEGLKKLNIDGHTAYSAILGCANIPDPRQKGKMLNFSEIGYFTVIQGKDDIYVIHKSIRGPNFDPKNPPINERNSAAFISDIMPIEVCQKTGDRASCIKTAP